MSGAAASSLQSLDDNLAQHVISYAALDSCKALSQTCRRFCHLVRSVRLFQLSLAEEVATIQALGCMPASRMYQRVRHIRFHGCADEEADNLPSWCRLCRLIWAGVQRWPEVERITLDHNWIVDKSEEGSSASEEQLAGHRGLLMGAVVPLRQATGLRHLTIENLVAHDSLLSVALLTQLTELTLAPWDDGGTCLAVGDPPRAPLAATTQLQALCFTGEFPAWLWNHEGQHEADLPLVLPPNLTRLEALVPTCGPGMFWRHIAACTRLVNLTVQVYCESAADHPSWMLYHLANSLQGLQHLKVEGDVNYASLAFLPEVLGLLAGTAAGQQQQEERGWDWEDLAAPGLGATAAYTSAVVPPPNMGGLKGLQTLEFPYGYRFRCCGPHHWHALAGCRSLQELQWVEAWQVPPADVTFLGVIDLEVLVSAPLLSATMTVLRAFPLLQQLVLQLEMPCAEVGAITAQQQEQQQQQVAEEEHGQPRPNDNDGSRAEGVQGAQPAQRQGQQEVLGSLSSACITLTCESASPATPPPALWRTLWHAMPALQRLELEWPLEVDLLQQLPLLAAFSGLTSLTLHSWRARAGQGQWLHVRQRVGLQALLRVLQGCSRLEELELRVFVGKQERAAAVTEASFPPAGHSSQNSSEQTGGIATSHTALDGGSNRSGPQADNTGSINGACLSRDQLVLSMQAALPSLKRLLQGKEGEVAPLAADTLAALRPGLVVGPARR